MPYLRPYDVFEYLPPEADRLSVTRTARLEDYLIQEGDILQTCSGRNLGPVTIADSYLTQSALSHDMRCCCNLGREPRKLRFYCVINAMCLCCQAVSNTRLTITASGFG